MKLLIIGASGYLGNTIYKKIREVYVFKYLHKPL